MKNDNKLTRQTESPSFVKLVVKTFVPLRITSYPAITTTAIGSVFLNDHADHGSDKSIVLRTYGERIDVSEIMRATKIDKVTLQVSLNILYEA